MVKARFGPCPLPKEQRIFQKLVNKENAFDDALVGMLFLSFTLFDLAAG